MTTTDIDPAAALRANLVAELARQGALTSPAWTAAVAEVPRHFFVSRFDVPTPDGLVGCDLADADRRATALPHAYSDTTLITQFDAGGTATSSSTTPSLMAIMLEALDVHDGNRVLEIGTGTGYNAALLCHRLGDGNVVSVDIDPQLVAAARIALDRAGYHPTLLASNGALGAPEQAPFDRIIATCGLDRIPLAWLRQMRMGGIIVAEVGFGLARLTKYEDGLMAGPFVGPAAFMHIRDDTKDQQITAQEMVAMTDADLPTRVAQMPDSVAVNAAEVILKLAMPGVRRVVIHLDTDVHVFVDPASGSWVRATPLGDGTAELVEYGHRPIWEQVCTLVDSWEQAERPPIERYGLTVTAAGRHTLWLADTDWAMALD